MSRSYKRPYIKEVKKKWAKRQASKKARRQCSCGDGCWYKKVYESWNITDYRFYCDKPKYRRK